MQLSPRLGRHANACEPHWDASIGAYKGGSTNNPHLGPMGGRTSTRPGTDCVTRFRDRDRRTMLTQPWMTLTYPFSFFRSRHDLALEILTLRQQLMVFQQQTRRSKLHRSDRFVWLLLMRVWPHWRTPLMIFRPETLIGWHRGGFRMFWRWRSRRRPGRPEKNQKLKVLSTVA